MSKLSSSLAQPPQFGFIKLAFAIWVPVALALGGWIYLSILTSDMSASPGLPDPLVGTAFGTTQFLSLLVMWVMMMAAMMLPSALPMIAAFARMRAADCVREKLWVYVLPFSLGYVATWAAFSLAATILHGWLSVTSILSPMGMSIVSYPLAAAFLIGAGIYQFTPLKQSCLSQCRSPLGFLMTQWRDGKWGAFTMGWKHGVFCVGCCWALMAVLFVVGVMNTLFILLISAYVVVEKTVPFSRFVITGIGTLLILAGFLILAQ